MSRPSWDFDDYGLQIMKTQHSVSQKIRILHEINKKGYFKPKCQASERCSFLCTQYLVDDSWCTDSSFSSLLVKLSQVFESALLDSVLKLAVIPVACAHFPTQFLLPVNFVFNMLWYSTPVNSPPFINDPLWLTLFVGVSMIVFRTITKSAVFLIIVLSKNKRYPEFILYGCHLLKLKCKYSNFVRYLIFDLH